MKVSVITPVWNDPRVSRCLDSIFSQTHPEIETIVVDGGSRKPTLEAIDRYRDRLNAFVSEPDEGIYDAMNKGIALATGDVIGILNADDRYYDDRVVADVVDTFNEGPAALVYGNLVMVDETGRVRRVWRAGAFAPWKFRLGWMPPHPTVFVRRDVYQKNGAFDLAYRIAADYEFLLRVLVKNGVPARYLDRFLVQMEMGGQSNQTARGILKANLEVRNAWRKNQLRGGLLAPIAKPLRKVGQFVRRRPVHP